MSDIWYKVNKGWKSQLIERVTVVKETENFLTIEYEYSHGRKSTSRSAKGREYHRTWAEARQYLREQALESLNYAERLVMEKLNHQVKVNMIPEEEPV